MSDLRQPRHGASFAPLEPFVFPGGPPHQVQVEPTEEVEQLGSVEASVVVDPEMLPRPPTWRSETACPATSVRSPDSSQITPVDRRTNPGNPSPSLRPHYRASPLLRDGPPPCPAPVLDPLQIPLLGALPSTGRSNTRPAPLGQQVPTFRADACSELAPPLRRSPPGQ